MSSQTINISLPKDLIEAVDKIAKSEFASRSDYIRQALVSRLKADKIASDDWDLLEVLSEEIAQKAKESGYKTDKDFVRATKEVRKSRLAKAEN
jgi:metal-responsive CopG/Arc/MetJ family transcriptional regulator